MSLKEEQDLLPENIPDAFMQLGKTAIYQAGEWLPDAASGFAGMRFIEDGEVLVFAIQQCSSGN